MFVIIYFKIQYVLAEICVNQLMTEISSNRYAFLFESRNSLDIKDILTLEMTFNLICVLRYILSKSTITVLVWVSLLKQTLDYEGKD